MPVESGVNTPGRSVGLLEKKEQQLRQRWRWNRRNAQRSAHRPEEHLDFDGLDMLPVQALNKSPIAPERSLVDARLRREATAPVSTRLPAKISPRIRPRTNHHPAVLLSKHRRGIASTWRRLDKPCPRGIIELSGVNFEQNLSWELGACGRASSPSRETCQHLAVHRKVMTLISGELDVGAIGEDWRVYSRLHRKASQQTNGRRAIGPTYL